MGADHSSSSEISTHQQSARPGAQAELYVQSTVTGAQRALDGKDGLGAHAGAKLCLIKRQNFGINR